MSNIFLSLLILFFFPAIAPGSMKILTAVKKFL